MDLNLLNQKFLRTAALLPCQEPAEPRALGVSGGCHFACMNKSCDTFCKPLPVMVLQFKLEIAYH